jgi:kumamolisin
MSSKRPRERRYLTRDEFKAVRGASHGDIEKVTGFATEHGLKVLQIDASRRAVVLEGSAAQIGEAFGVRLAVYEHPNGSYRGRTGKIYLPAQLIPSVRAVLGLDNRPQASPRFNRAVQVQSIRYYPPQVASLYDYPPGTDGSGQTVALIELGGGFKMADLQTFFGDLGIPIPRIATVDVDGGQNAPTGDPSGPDGEVMLDLEVLGSIAPGANLAAYFSTNTDAGFLDAVTTAIHDSENSPSVISISWGSPESEWTGQAMQAMEEAFTDAASLGITVCVASGDNGSSDGLSDGLAHVDFPASAPHALGCGGTRLESTGQQITSETVWNDQPSGGASGGGISAIFPLPAWQSSDYVPPSVNPGHQIGRGVPDVAGDADPVTGYFVVVDGTQASLGGTSAVAPLWAGLIARINQSLGKPVGYLNPLIYGEVQSSGALREVVSGNNGAYSAKPGWDACTGWGSPNGAKILSVLD